MSVKPSSRNNNTRRRLHRTRRGIRSPLTDVPQARSIFTKPRPAGPLLTLPERHAHNAAIARETRRIVFGNGRYVQRRACTRTITSSLSAIPAGFTTCSTTPPAGDYDVVHEIGAQIEMSRQATTVYPHYSEALATWRNVALGRIHSAASDSTASSSKTSINFSSSSPLTIAHQLSSSHDSVGILLPVSPKRAGGSYLNGANHHEACLARSSSLTANLESPYAAGFYQEHKSLNDNSGLRTHTLVYCPDVVVFRHANDSPSPTRLPLEEFVAPYKIDILAAAPVNAAAVRNNYTVTPDEQSIITEGIRSATKERIARSLLAFEMRGVRTLILPPFGAEDGMNVSIDEVAAVLAELLVCGDEYGPARFRESFDLVTFAVRGHLLKPFRCAFDTRVFEDEVVHVMTSK